MTRIVDGIYDELVMDTGFFIKDKEADILCEWLAAYADALEKAWIRKGSQGNPKSAKHTKVRSFIRAVERKRKGDDKPSAPPTDDASAKAAKEGAKT